MLESLANAGPSMTRSLSLIATFPFPNETIEKCQRGDYANLTAIVDLTLSRIDHGMFTGTRWEGDLTELELQWGRTIGQFPSPYTQGQPADGAVPLGSGTLDAADRTNADPAGALHSGRARGHGPDGPAFHEAARHALRCRPLHGHVELPQTGGLYAAGNVTYRGTEVGRVESVRLTEPASKRCCR